MYIAITGHRPDKLNDEWEYDGPVSRRIAEITRQVYRDCQPEWVISGFALGVDLICAAEAIAMGIRVLAAIPFVGQDSIWPKASRRMYWSMLEHPLVEYYVVSGGGYSREKMHIRNQWMVNQLTDPRDILLAFFDGSLGGTAGCIKYAHEQCKNVVEFGAEDWYDVVESDDSFKDDDIPF